MKINFKKIALEGFIGLGFLYIGVLVSLIMFQNKFIYHPTNEKMEVLERFAESEGISKWENEKGEVIGWRIPTSLNEGKWDVIVFHGNAGMALNRLYFADGLRSVGCSEYYVFEYPGYGAREGKLSEESLVNAAVEAFDELKKKSDKPIILMGESLGSSVASQVAARRPDQVKGLLLITPFDNLLSAGAVHFPFFPLKLFVRDRYESDKALKNYHGPVAFMIAGRDLTVPAWIGKRFYKGYHGPKKLWMMKNANHNSINFSASENWWREIFEFLGG